MAQETYLIRTGYQAKAAYEELKMDQWPKTTLLIHEDLVNADQYFNLIRIAASYQIQSFRFALNDDQTISVRVQTGAAGGMTLNFTFRIESLVYEPSMHMLVLSYSEGMDGARGGLFGGLMGGIARMAMGGAGFLESMFKSNPAVQVSSDRLTLDLDAFEAFRKAASWDHFGRSLGDDLIVTYRGIQDHMLIVDLSWRF